MTEDVLVLVIIFACFYPVYLWAEWVRKSTERAIKENLTKKDLPNDR